MHTKGVIAYPGGRGEGATSTGTRRGKSRVFRVGYTHARDETKQERTKRKSSIIRIFRVGYTYARGCSRALLLRMVPGAQKRSFRSRVYRGQKVKKVSRHYTREVGAKSQLSQSAIRARQKWNFWSRLNSARERHRGAPPVRTDPGAVERAKS